MDFKYLETIAEQKNQRKPMLVGDIFAVNLASGGYLFGRVLEDGAVFNSACTVVLYDLLAVDAGVGPIMDRLTAERILIPPVHIGRADLRSGFARTVANAPIDGSAVPDPLLVLRLAPGRTEFVPSERSFRAIDRSDEANSVFDMDRRPAANGGPPYGSLGSGGGTILNAPAYAELIWRARGEIVQMVD